MSRYTIRTRRRRRIMLALDLMSLVCSLMAIITAHRKQKSARETG